MFRCEFILLYLFQMDTLNISLLLSFQNYYKYIFLYLNICLREK